MAVKFALSTTATKSLKDCWSFLSRFLSLFLFLCCMVPLSGLSQGLSQQRHAYSEALIQYQSYPSYHDTLETAENEVPDPKSVMYKSMIIPGWGQITNKQIWKVPIVYGLLGGLTWYSVFLNKKYHDYRAAFYNLSQEDTDFRFGQTPPYLAQETSGDFLRNNRNSFRNRRDFIYITIGLAYGLNIIDAYVFAHMRSFDVSENLSVAPSVSPSVLEGGSPGITLSLQLFDKKNGR